MNERDILTEKKYAREEGREEGAKEENLRIALNMKKAGIAISVIEQVTGLSSSQINNL